jgi:hypothetical protein
MSQTIQDNMGMTLTVTVAGVQSQVQLITPADHLTAWMFQYGDREFFDPYKPERTGDEAQLDAVCTVIIGEWLKWQRQREDSYARMLSALLSEAATDPTENYDRMESGGWKDTHDIGKKERSTEYKPGTINTVENFTAGDDVSTPALESKSVSTPSGVKDEGKTTDEKTTDTDTRLFQDYRVHGNIGVSTAADMAEKILHLNGCVNLGRQAIKEFVDLYTIYR